MLPLKLDILPDDCLHHNLLVCCLWMLGTMAMVIQHTMIPTECTVSTAHTACLASSDECRHP